MGRTAEGWGHNPGERGNDAHNPKTGEFASGGGDSGGGHSSAGARVAFAERAKLRAQAAKAKPEAKLAGATKAAKAAAGRGDHQRAQQHSGRGYAVAPHMGHASVGTHQARGGGGGGSVGGGGGSSGGGSSGGRGGPVRLTKNAKERVAIGKAIDARHYPGEPEVQTIQFGRGENVPTSRANAGRRSPSGRRR
jgi:hypothetical protein